MAVAVRGAVIVSKYKGAFTNQDVYRQRCETADRSILRSSHLRLGLARRRPSVLQHLSRGDTTYAR